MTAKKLPLLVITAPSCAGKDYLTKCLFQQNPDQFAMVVSTTTRAPRAGENHGVDYHFVDQAEFDRLEESSQLLESVRFGSKCYGTSSHAIDSIQDDGRFPVLIVEPVGAQNIRNWCAKNSQPALFAFLRVDRELALERFLARFIEDYSELENAISEKVFMEDMSEADAEKFRAVNFSKKFSSLVENYSGRIHMSMYKESSWGDMLDYTHRFGPMIIPEHSERAAKTLARALQEQVQGRAPMAIPKGQIPVVSSPENSGGLDLHGGRLYDMPYVIKKTLLTIKDHPVSASYLKDIILKSEQERLQQQVLDY